MCFPSRKTDHRKKGFANRRTRISLIGKPKKAPSPRRKKKSRVGVRRIQGTATISSAPRSTRKLIEKKENSRGATPISGKNRKKIPALRGTPASSRNEVNPPKVKNGLLGEWRKGLPEKKTVGDASTIKKKGTHRILARGAGQGKKQLSPPNYHDRGGKKRK